MPGAFDLERHHRKKYAGADLRPGHSLGGDVQPSRQIAARNVPVVAITDSPFSPLSPSASIQFEIVEADYAGFRSLAATLSLAMALAVATGALKESKTST